MENQTTRFCQRIEDGRKRWKLSPLDLEAHRRWYDYSKARDLMLEATDSKHAPWFIARTDDKRRGRLNCIAHVLSRIPYKKIKPAKVELPKRSDKRKYDDEAPLKGRHFVVERYRFFSMLRDQRDCDFGQIPKPDHLAMVWWRNRGVRE